MDDSHTGETISLAPHFSLYNRAFAWAGVTDVEAYEDETGKVSVRWTGAYTDPAEHTAVMANALINGIMIAYMRETAGRGPSHESLMRSAERRADEISTARSPFGVPVAD